MKVKVPRYIKKKMTRKMRAQLELLQEAREGSEKAIKRLKAHSCSVWSDGELDAINYYLKVKDSITREGRMMHMTDKIRLCKHVPDEMEEARILWIKYIGEDYYLLCAEWDDGGLTLWVCTFIRYRFQPMCDVTCWSDINQESEREVII